MPEIGAGTGQEAAALTGLVLVARDSRTHCAKRAIAGGRCCLRRVMFPATFAAAHHDPSLRRFADRLRKPGRPREGITTSVSRKRVTTASAMQDPSEMGRPGPMTDPVTVQADRTRISGRSCGRQRVQSFPWCQGCGDPELIRLAAQSVCILETERGRVFCQIPSKCLKVRNFLKLDLRAHLSHR